jgi:hypothetical protein
MGSQRAQSSKQEDHRCKSLNQTESTDYQFEECRIQVMQGLIWNLLKGEGIKDNPTLPFSS